MDIDQVGLSLTLDNMALVSVPSAGLEQIPPLSSLVLSNNFISSITTSLRYLSDLQSLDLSCNMLSYLSGPSDILNVGGITSSPFFRLQRLNLSNNWLCNLEVLPSALTELNLANNNLERLPAQLSALSKLCFLDFSRNKLSSEGKS